MVLAFDFDDPFIDSSSPILVRYNSGIVQLRYGAVMKFVVMKFAVMVHYHPRIFNTLQNHNKSVK